MYSDIQTHYPVPFGNAHKPTRTHTSAHTILDTIAFQSWAEEGGKITLIQVFFPLLVLVLLL